MKKVALLLFLGFSWVLSPAQDKPIHEIHAQMMFNFIKYIQWPNEGEGGDFVVGVMGDDDLFNTLKGWYDGKPKGAKKYVIKKLSGADEASTCSVVYLGKSKNKEFDNVKTASSGKPILTITDSFNLGQKGSCINFKIVDGKLKFELNQAAVTGSNLKVSSALSSMAILI
jgi:YfiR/HmsC-like